MNAYNNLKEKMVDKTKIIQKDFDKKYLVFADTSYESCGGMNDLIGSCNSVKEAVSLIEDSGHDSWQIVLYKTMEILYSDRKINLSDMQIAHCEKTNKGTVLMKKSEFNKLVNNKRIGRNACGVEYKD